MQNHTNYVKTNLEQPVNRKPADYVVGKELHDSKDSKNNPVSKPLCVVVFVVSLQRFHRAVSRIQESYDVAYQLLSHADHEIQR